MSLIRRIQARSLRSALFSACAAAALLISFACVSTLPAQVTTAEVVGTVMDSSGSLVAGVRMILRNKATGDEFTARSDASGNYSFRLLPIGNYSMQAEMQGFKKWASPDIALAAGDRLRQEVRLELGMLEQTVEVAASTPALQTDSSSLGSLTEEKAVQNLPLNGRNFVVLAQLAAGSAGEGNTSLSMASGARPDDRRRSSSVTVNAFEPAYNNYQIDGMDNNEPYTGTVVVKPSIDALAEVKVQTLLVPAEMGRTSAGSINLLTKSGANEFHGTLFEFFRNEKMDARNFFAAAGPKPSYKQNQFGGSLGGPIRKNRTFFFGDYEGFRLRQGQTTVSTIPTVAEHTGNFAGVAAIFDPLSLTTVNGVSTRTRFPGDQIPASRMDSAGVNAVNLYPVPLTSGLANNYTWSPNKQQRDDTMDIRLDHRISDRDTLYGRYSFNDTFTYTPTAFPTASNGISPVGDVSYSGPALQRSQGTQITEMHSFTPKLFGEFKAGYTRMAMRSLPPNTGNNASQQIGIKGINYDWDSSGLSQMNPSGYRGLGDARFLPLITISNLFQEVGNLMYTAGPHSLKFGVDMRRRQTTPFQSNSPRGLYTFDSNLTNDPSGSVSGSGNPIASFLLGYPASTTRNKTLSWNGYRAIEFGSYIQDDWRVNRWLTLNLGLRYDYYSPLTEVANRLSNVDLKLGKIVQAGIDTGATAGVQKDWLNLGPRFGFAAKITDKTVLRGGYSVMFMPPAWQSQHTFRNPPYTSLYTATASTLTPINRLSDGLPLPTPTDPANPTGSLAPVAFDLESPYSQQYSFGIQREATAGIVATINYVGSLGRKLTPSVGMTLDLDVPGPAAGAIQQRRPYYSVFPGVSSISMMGNWVTSSYQALQSTLERRYKNGLGFVANYTWAHGIDDSAFYYYATGPKALRGNAYSDIRHRFTLTSTIDLPFGKNSKSVTSALVRNWGFNIIADISTGLPFDITSASARNNNGTTDRPNLVGDPILPADQRTVSRWFNTSAFAAQTLYTYGNFGRYALYGPGKFKLDFSAHREFGFTERLKLQMRAEAFNITNTPAFGAPGASFGSSAFGVISSAGLARNIQIAMKLVF